jgi:hypothetical protein
MNAEPTPARTDTADAVSAALWDQFMAAKMAFLVCPTLHNARLAYANFVAFEAAFCGQRVLN